MHHRPELNKNISVNDFKEFYWLKEELAAFCRAQGIDASGGKHALEKRIIHYLHTGEVVKEKRVKTSKSNFDWKKAELLPATVITDNYKNSENVRAFMTAQTGKHFHFNTEFMNWMKCNTGKTLDDAVVEWKRIDKKKKIKGQTKKISSQFEYNTYIRDFLADNKELTMKEAICFWKLKRDLRGNNKYSKEDLKFLK